MSDSIAIYQRIRAIGLKSSRSSSADKDNDYYKSENWLAISLRGCRVSSCIRL